MPIYEFYCPGCHVLFNFFSSRVDTETTPGCPKCDRERLERRPARFAMIKSRPETEDLESDPFGGLDEQQLERAMESLAGEFEGLEDEEDPRQMARFFRRFGEATGMALGPRMQEMLGRLEAGEDPDLLEQELGDGLEDDDDSLAEWFQVKKQAQAFRKRRPRQDDELYFL